jgi:hypothetical protein
VSFEPGSVPGRSDGWWIVGHPEVGRKRRCWKLTADEPPLSAGGLVFVGAAQDNRLRAFDSKSGKELWLGQLERQANAVPMTYQGKNGNNT